MTNPNRDPKGIPTGGQYAEQPRSEPTMGLGDPYTDYQAMEYRSYLRDQAAPTAADLLDRHEQMQAEHEAEMEANGGDLDADDWHDHDDDRFALLDDAVEVLRGTDTDAARQVVAAYDTMEAEHQAELDAGGGDLDAKGWERYDDERFALLDDAVAALGGQQDGPAPAPAEPDQSGHSQADLDAYDAAREAVDGNYHRLRANGTDHTTTAMLMRATGFAAAQRIDPADMPAPGETRLSGDYGTLAAAAEHTVRSRAAAEGLELSGASVEGLADGLVQDLLDTREFTTRDGVEMRARIVRTGMPWGREGQMTSQRDMVFFFDARHEGAPMVGDVHDPYRGTDEAHGQHISNYHLNTLTDDDAGAGLDLYGGVTEWSIDRDTYEQVHAWMRARTRKPR